LNTHNERKWKMPNWCSNGVTITHSDPAKIAALADAMAEGKFLNHIIPVPEDLHITAGFLGDEAAQKELERKTAENVEKHGFGNWYDFCTNRWGTKWDVDCDGTVQLDDDGHTIHANFDSAWSPPCAVYEEMLEQGYEVVAYYYESGMGFVGKWDNGYDDCYNLDGENSRTVRAVIGDELDDYWCISESMAEYEAENEEADELTEWYEDGVEKQGLKPHNE
jgi:hypothetical protein